MVDLGCHHAAVQIGVWLEGSGCPLSEKQTAALTDFFIKYGESLGVNNKKVNLEGRLRNYIKELDRRLKEDRLEFGQEHATGIIAQELEDLLNDDTGRTD